MWHARGSGHLPEEAPLIGNARSTPHAWYQLRLGIVEGLSLKAGLRNEYVSSQPGDNNTLNYYGNLGYDF
jgi:hypothetical protein